MDIDNILDKEIYLHGFSCSVYPSVPYRLVNDNNHRKDTLQLYAWMLRVKILCGSCEYREKKTKVHIDHMSA